MRRYTLGAIDQGIKPAVVTAMAKYNATEISRKIINDAMDIAGGSGISRGPRNLLAHFYIATPIGITVEGANILTRTLIIFGQGALRAHPYALAEVNAIAARDVRAFDKAFWGHVAHIVRNLSLELHARSRCRSRQTSRVVHQVRHATDRCTARGEANAMLARRRPGTSAPRASE